MRRILFCAVLTLAAVAGVAASSEAELAAAVARLEARVAELEARLGAAEQQSAPTVERVQEQGATAEKRGWIPMENLNPFVRHAWVNEAWTRPEPWDQVRRGMSPDEVIKVLGEPTRTVESLKPRVDLVYFYEGGIRSQGVKLRGKVSFRKGEVIAVQKPNF